MTELPPGSGAEPPVTPPYPPPVNTYAILSAAFALGLPPLGVWLGYKARREIKQTGERGIELTNVGIRVGWILTCLTAVMLLVWGWALLASIPDILNLNGR